MNTHPFISQHAEWLALGSASLWLLHPFHVSTTLYIIQRMTMLSALFSLLGILVYLKGRECLQTRPHFGLGLMTGSIIVFTVLAILCKETGALLPLLLAALEFTVLRDQCSLAKHPHKRWIVLFFGIPALVLLAYLAHFLMPYQAVEFAPKGFTAYQRLLTEPRILTHYLYDLAIPKLYSGSLYNDDFPISTGLLTPPTTLLASSILVTLLFLALRARKTYPLISLAILFYCVGHLLESSTAPLELYYEHRNYLPSIFLYLPLVTYGIEARPKPTVFAIIALSLMMVGFTAAKAKLWGNEKELLIFWAEQNPHSARAQRSAADVYFQLRQYDKVFEILDRAVAANPKNLKIRLNRIAFACLTGKQQDDGYFAEMIQLTQASPVYFDSNIYDMLESLFNLLGKAECRSLNVDQLSQLTESILTNPTVKNDKSNQFIITNLQGIVALHRKDRARALALFSRALELSGDPETGLQETALLATHGFYPEALSILEASEKMLYSTHMQINGILARHEYPEEINRLRKQIEDDILHNSAKPK